MTVACCSNTAITSYDGETDRKELCWGGGGGISDPNCTLTWQVTGVLSSPANPPVKLLPKEPDY